MFLKKILHLRYYGKMDDICSTLSLLPHFFEIYILSFYILPLCSNMMHHKQLYIDISKGKLKGAVMKKGKGTGNMNDTNT